MFRENKHLQTSFFDSQHLMSNKQKKMLAQSWAHTFRENVFKRIPEASFAVLFSEAHSRPNAAINVIVGGDILKEGFDWSDEELESELTFNLQVRYALGLDDIGQLPPTLRTVYNLRRRVREHAEEKGENLYETVLNCITDKQLSELKVKTGWQRMDSTQLLSNIARLNRLELVMSVFQKGVKGLSKSDQVRWHELEASYLNQDAQSICYRLKKEESETHLKRLGELMLKLLAELEEIDVETEAAKLVRRTIEEHYKLTEAEPDLVPGQEMSANSLQSPHDPEATYRKKQGRENKGYVANISETCDPDNEIQLITSVQTASNTTDDGTLLAQAVEGMAERGLEVDEITVDGGYNGETAAESGEKHQFILRPTTIRAGQYNEDKLGWDRYEWHKNEDGKVSEVSCPGGQRVRLGPGGKKGWHTARFDRELCEACPFFNKECRVKNYKKKPPTIHIRRKTIRTALQRQNMSRTNYAIRSNVESTIRAVKRPFAGGKLSVRGLIRAHMVVCNSVIMANLRRIHRYMLRKEEQKRAEMASDGLESSIFVQLMANWAIFIGFYRNFEWDLEQSHQNNLNFAN